VNRLLPLCVLLCGCSDLGGAWIGTCDFSSGASTLTGGIDLQISEGKGNGIKGEVDFAMSDGRDFSGDLDGIRADSSVELSGNILEAQAPDDSGIDTGGVAATGGDPFSFSLEGRLEGEDDVIVGTCVFGVPGGTGGLTGALRVER
jgi:hypothetical protein